MVSIVLLTTEEILQRNGFWHSLDSIWITQELEPFEDLKPEHIYAKPLSRDVYYARFPDIPRSESEDEIAMTVNGFKNKHQEWKTKIRIRKLDAKRRRSCNSVTCSVRSDNNSMVNEVTKRITSFNGDNEGIINQTFKDNDERVRDFFKRLAANVPPPPIEDSNGNNSIVVPQTKDMDIIEVPDYNDFENDRMYDLKNKTTTGPITSTLKKGNHEIIFDSLIYSDSDEFESWYETIYGVSDLMDSNDNDFEETNKITTNSDCFISWNEIVNMCDLGDSILKSKESLDNENLISHSHCLNNSISDISDDDEEIAYTKFAFNKLHQSLKIKGQYCDSSSMENLNCENVELLNSNLANFDPSLYRIFYRLAPSIDEDSVILSPQ